MYYAYLLEYICYLLLRLVEYDKFKDNESSLGLGYSLSKPLYTIILEYIMLHIKLNDFFILIFLETSV